jgi:hypothetical protein
MRMTTHSPESRLDFAGSVKGSLGIAARLKNHIVVASAQQRGEFGDIDTLPTECYLVTTRALADMNAYRRLVMHSQGVRLSLVSCRGPILLQRGPCRVTGQKSDRLHLFVVALDCCHCVGAVCLAWYLIGVS